jgi:hypothetical protein
MHEAVLEDGLADDALALGQGHQGHELRLQVGGEARIDAGLDVHRLQPRAIAADDDAVVGALDAGAGFLDLGQQGLDQVSAGVGQADLAAGHGRGDGIGAGLDPVGDHRVGGARQLLDAGDGDGRRAGALDLRAHLVQALGQIDDLGLAGGGLQHGDAAGQHGGQHGVLCRADRDEREGDLRALQPARGRGVDVALV